MADFLVGGGWGGGKGIKEHENVKMLNAHVQVASHTSSLFQTFRLWTESWIEVVPAIWTAKTSYFNRALSTSFPGFSPTPGNEVGALSPTNVMEGQSIREL